MTAQTFIKMITMMITRVSVPLVVKGNCGVAGAGSATVSADLVSGGMAGQELVVKATITNTGSSLKTFTVNAAGFREWQAQHQLIKVLLY